MTMSEGFQTFGGLILTIFVVFGLLVRWALKD